MSYNKIDSLISLVNNSKGVSQRKLARRFKISQPYVCKLLSYVGIKYYKWQKTPKTNAKQAIVQRKRLSKLCKGKLRPSKQVSIVMDNKSYFSLSVEKRLGKDGYYSQDKRCTPDDVKFNYKEKYAAKMLVWVAISECGHSSVYFAPRNCSVTAKI